MSQRPFHGAKNGHGTRTPATGRNRARKERCQWFAGFAFDTHALALSRELTPNDWNFPVGQRAELHECSKSSEAGCAVRGKFRSPYPRFKLGSDSTRAHGSAPLFSASLLSITAMRADSSSPSISRPRSANEASNTAACVGAI